LTNLRLLDLDRRHDWPSPAPTPSSLSSKSADQKHRIKCAEWVLYRLFELWDPNETRDKLSPFFPPLEPLQSLNLRAALYRCLNELKKNGVLGRETILRKTMLDECRDEKFWDVVLLFSTQVCRKGLTGQRGKRDGSALARRLALSGKLGVCERESLLPLAVAHRAALGEVLRRKEVLRGRYREFAGVLRDKSRELDGRAEMCRARQHGGEQLSPSKVVHIKKQLQENWTGSGAWVDTLLHGDENEQSDVTFKRPFQEVWSELKDGKPRREPEQRGLLVELEGRVQEQRTRLQQWKAFHTELQSSKGVRVSSKAPPSKNDSTATYLKFDEHQIIKLGAATDPTAEAYASQSRPSEYAARCGAVLDMMHEELAQASSKRPMQPQLMDLPLPSNALPTPSLPTPSLHKRMAPARTYSDTGAVMNPESVDARPEHSLRNDPLSNSSRSSGEHHMSEPDVTSAGAEEESTDEEPLLSSPTPRVSTTAPSPASSRPTPSRTPRPGTLRTLSLPLSPRIDSPTPTPSKHTTTESRLAAEILSSLGAASATPLPTKHLRPLSLAERTRMSIARTASDTSIPQIPSPLDSSSSPANGSPPPISPTAQHQAYNEQLQSTFNRRASLLERTRQSMSLLPAQEPKLPAQWGAKRRSLRQSHGVSFPVNQFETPHKRVASSSLVIREEEEGRKSDTPKEKLFDADALYDSVFKSRPKVGLSPPGSGVVERRERRESLGEVLGGRREGEGWEE